MPSMYLQISRVSTQHIGVFSTHTLSLSLYECAHAQMPYNVRIDNTARVHMMCSYMRRSIRAHAQVHNVCARAMVSPSPSTSLPSSPAPPLPPTCGCTRECACMRPRALGSRRAAPASPPPGTSAKGGGGADGPAAQMAEDVATPKPQGGYLGPRLITSAKARLIAPTPPRKPWQTQSRRSARLPAQPVRLLRWAAAV